MKFVGFMKGSFKDKNSGRDVNFAKIYVNYEADGVKGLKAEEIKCNYKLVPELEKLKLGTEIAVYYDKYQRVEMINVNKGV